MKVVLIRESVVMGDNIDVPHTSELTVAARASVASILIMVFHSGYLASIAGGEATWSAVSRVPLAVLAQQWAAPKLLLPVPPLAALDFSDGRLFLHFNYHTQQDPNLVYNRLHQAHTSRNQP